MWWDCDFDQVVSFLDAADADIIGLQEVAPEDKSRDVISYLAKRGYQYVFAPITDIQKKGWKKDPVGNAIFSKYDILKSKVHVLSDEDSRIAVEATIKVGDKTLNVFNTHLLHTHQEPSAIQDLQAEGLLRVLSSTDTIVMGDFNALPESNAVKIMKKSLRDTVDTHRSTWSLNVKGCPVCKIGDLRYCLDYIFVTKDLRTRSFQVENSKASDHLPISVVVEVW